MRCLRRKGNTMKTIATLAFVAGVAFAAPSFAQDPEAASKETNPQHEAFKAYVNEALDAHKGKQSKKAKAQMKAYVGQALDAQQKRELQEQIDTGNMNFKESLSHIFLGANPLYPDQLKKLACFATLDDSTDSAMAESCLRESFGPQDQSTFGLPLDTGCTGKHLFGIIKGTCHNPQFKKACLVVANVTNNENVVGNCKADD